HNLLSFPDRFSAHLLRYNFGHHAPTFGLQHGLSFDTPKQVQQRRDYAGPPRLVTGSEPRSIVPVEILEKQDQVPPMRILLEPGRTSVDRPSSIGITQESARQPADKLLRHFEQRHVATGT